MEVSTHERRAPTARNYVIYTFRRAYFQRRVTEVTDSDGSRHAVFSIGLLTDYYERIFYFVKQTRSDLPQPWFLQGSFRESDHRLMRFQKLPDRVSYFDEPAELLALPGPIGSGPTPTAAPPPP